MKIYIIGAGGVGGYFGGMLARGGQDVTFVARGAHYEAMKAQGLEVRTVKGDFTISPVQIIPTISEITDPDLILVTCKSYDLISVGEELRSVIKPKTIFITCQNGIDNDLVLTEILKHDRVYPGTIHIVSAIQAPGAIAQTGGLRRITFGERGHPSNPELRQIETMMTSCDIRAIASDDIVRDLWKKFAMIIPWAGMTSYTGRSVDQILGASNTRELFCQSLREAIEVARATGVRLPDDTYKEILTLTDKTTPGARSSMLIDIENGRRTEVETLHGTLIRLAREHAVQVPVNQMIYESIVHRQPGK